MSEMPKTEPGTTQSVPAKRHPVERGRWLKFGLLSGEFEVFTARRLVHGTTYEVVGPKHRVDTASVEIACLEYLAEMAGDDGHKYLADGLAALVERVNGRRD